MRAATADPPILLSAGGVLRRYGLEQHAATAEAFQTFLAERLIESERR